ncbi:MAG: hypothetical protein J5659_03435 [Clostridia bacterium]|nr:hypothetical protein [Clostridia bacterium]
MDGILSPAFLQAACAHATPEPPAEPDGIVLRTNEQITLTGEISGVGEITVKSVYNGEVETQTFNNPNAEDLEINTDADTDIEITGSVTVLMFGPPFVGKLTSFRALNSDLRELSIGNQNNVKTLCLPVNLTESLGTYTGVTTIKYPASDSAITTKIADIITNAIAADGVVYTDMNGTYYNLIEDAAGNKGWTVEQLPA